MPMQDALCEVARQKGYDVFGYKDPSLVGKLVDYDYVIYHPNTPPKDIKCKGKVGWWMCDLRHPNDLQPGNPDVIFLCNTHYIGAYQEKFECPVYYMPQCGLDVRGRDSGRRFDTDFVFIGDIMFHKYHANRIPIISGLKKEGVDVTMITGERFTEDQVSIYRHAPFCLSISPHYGGYTSNRLYNILASGGFCFSLYFPGIDRLFENNKHLVWFKTVGELCGLMDYYYENPEEYCMIKEAGWRLFEEKHTASARVKNMLDIMKGRLNNFQGYLA